MAKRVPISIAAAEATYDAAYSAHQIAYDWQRWLETAGDHAIDALATHAKRMERAVKAAAAFEPHEDIGPLFAENDRLLAEYQGVIACRQAARRVVDAAYKAFVLADRALDRALDRAQPVRRVA